MLDENIRDFAAGSDPLLLTRKGAKHNLTLTKPFEPQEKLPREHPWRRFAW
jgi:hypothetical protein